MKYGTLDVKVKAVDEKNFTIRAIFSTPAVDRHGEVIKQDGWKLDNFRKNPVVLWAHDNFAPAIGKVIDIAILDGNLEGTIQFAAKEYDFAMTIFKLYAGEYVRAISVGFNNEKWEFDEANDIMTLLQNELYEVSCVNVPANQEAVVKMLERAKAGGVDISPLERKIKRADEISEKIMGQKQTPPTPPTPPKPPPPPTPPAPTPTKDIHNDIGAEKINAIVAAAEAVETLSNCESGTIAAAVKMLMEGRDVAKTRQPTVGGTSQSNKISIKDVNRLIRSLAKGK